jgi:4-methylaminobutanoate oxidase (formaldehyde-forming)
LAAADVDKPVGSVIYTQLCNDRGGIECDLTLARLGENHFYGVTGSAFGTHDLHWITSNIPHDDTVFARDMTSSRATINLCGPLARRTLEKVVEEDISNAAFPFARCKQITIGAAPVLAVRIGYVGELGWELHVPTEYGAHLYETLWAAGQEFGIANVGYRAIDTLRMEKGYLYWSSDITPDYNPFEAGLGFRVALNKGDFVGREALRTAKANGVKRRLCCFTLERYAGAIGGEAIIRDGRVLGVTSSGNYGHTIGKTIVLGYLPIEETTHRDFTVEVFGESIAAVRHDTPLYDPRNERLKS